MRVMALAVEHRKILELLPWYVNGTLAERERSELEHHLHECPRCNAALMEERRLSRFVQRQDSVPMLPKNGVRELLRRIDHGGERHSFSLGVPALGYGLAAIFGGAIVWVFIALFPGPRDESGEFSTLTAGTFSAEPRIDVVFVAEPSAAELEQLIAEVGGVLVGGPSDLGRYTIGLEPASESRLNEILATLRADSRIQFAGRSFIGEAGDDP